MAKSIPKRDPHEPLFVEGRWYQIFTPEGFTLYGRFVCSLGLGFHRFEYCIYTRNAGNQWLSEACVALSRKAVVSSPWPGYRDTLVSGKHEYFGEPWWMKQNAD